MNTWAPAKYAPTKAVLGQLGVPKLTNLTAIGGMLLFSGSTAFMLASKKASTVEQVARGAASLFGAYLVVNEGLSTKAARSGNVMSDYGYPALGLAALAAALTGLGYWALKGKV